MTLNERRKKLRILKLFDLKKEQQAEEVFIIFIIFEFPFRMKLLLINSKVILIIDYY